MKIKFKVTNNKLEKLASIFCPYCLCVFGITLSFMDRVGEVNFHYTCPYCGKEAGLKKD